MVDGRAKNIVRIACRTTAEPEEDAGETEGQAGVSEIERDGTAVDQHADPRWARRAGDPKCDQCDAEGARDHDGNAGKVLAEQQSNSAKPEW